jgi:hypothetical protein
MSVDQLPARPAPPSLDVACPAEPPHPAHGPRRTEDEGLPRVVILATVATDTIDSLLLLVAHGDQEAFTSLQDRMAGLVRVNVRRILRDAARSDAVTQQTFADLPHDAIHFDPHHDTAQTWMLTRAHQHAMARLHALDTANDRHVPTIDHPAPIPILTS